MAIFDLSEQEQLEALKDWWSRWQRWILSAVAVVAVVILSYMGWGRYQTSQAEGAATAYEAMEKVFTAKDVAKTRAAADAMVKDYPRQALTARAMLLAAKLAFDNKDMESARSALAWVVDHAQEDAMVDLGRLRLAAVLLDMKQYDAALKAVAEPDITANAGVFADMRGDVLALKGDKEGAKKAYEAALQLLGQSRVTQTVALKLSALK